LPSVWPWVLVAAMKSPLSAVVFAWLLLIVPTGFAVGVPGTQRQAVPLNDDWRFALQPAGTGFSAPGFADDAWEKVTLPHTWNAWDGQDGGNDYVRGDGWYRRAFATESAWAGRRVWLEVDAAGRVAEVWLNGVRLGEHRGAHARFRFDLTPQLVAAGRNVLVLRVNNETNAIIPISGDFTMGGGLYRSVRLLVVDPVHLALNDLGSPGVYLTPQVISADTALVDLKVRLENDSAGAASGRVVARVYDPQGRPVAETAADYTAAAGAGTEVRARLTVPQPQLWQGRPDPALYRVAIEVLRDNRLVDGIEQTLGLRTVRIDPAAGFFLNGRPYAMHGVNRHPQIQDKGYALSEADHRRDYELIQEIGATTVRLAHYQHDAFEYALCDQLGLLVWAEVGFVNEGLPDDPVSVENAAQQLRELIRQNYNHPAIFCWGIGNETRDRTAALLQKLQTVAKEEDPSRPTTYASNHGHKDVRSTAADLLAFNRYHGWYASHGAFGGLGAWLDEERRLFPARRVAMSEYGAGASVYQQEQQPALVIDPAGRWHPEQWQARFHENAWLDLSQRPYLWATYIWAMFDFASDARSEGDLDGVNDKGLVTHDRAIRKDAFYWFKSNWTTAPMVYITSRRDTVRFAAKTEVKVYSNADTVELRLNGVSLGEKTSTDRRFVWPEAELKPGPNIVSVVARQGGRLVASDSCCWQLTTGEPHRLPVAPPKPAN